MGFFQRGYGSTLMRSPLKIALCSQLGAGCTDIAQSMAAKKGVTAVNSEAVIKEIAIGTTKSFRELERRVVSGEVDIDMLMQSQLQELAVENENLVVEGRSGFMLLDDRSFFKVLLVAPEERRVKHISQRRKITLEEAKIAVDHSDTDRAGLVKRFFNKGWLSPINYSIVLNTGPSTFETIANLILDSYKAYVSQ